MKSFVVQTYYQLMHSIAMALTLDEKPMLYFAVQYLGKDEEFLDRIRDTGVFHNVVGINRRGDLTKFIAELDKTKGMSDGEIDSIGSSLFDEYLEPYYSELFKDADREDAIYIYNDYQWYFYYIANHFKEIIGVEDGYASLTQQLKVHKFAGDRELVKPFLGRYYPLPSFRHPNVREIISSRQFDDLPDEYKDMVRVIDFNDLIVQNQESFKRAINCIFETEELDITDHEVLFLAQPLARSLYCLSIEEYLLDKKLIQRELKKGKRICFKSHPADSINSKFYEREGVMSLPGTFPVEVLNYKDCTFEKILSFGSTGVETLSCSGSNELIFGDRNSERRDVEEFIRREIKGEQALIDIYFIVRDLNDEVLVNIFSGAYSPDKYFKMRVNVLVCDDLADEARDYFKKGRLADAVEKYKKTHTYKGVCLIKEELDDLVKASDTFSDPRIIISNGIGIGNLSDAVDPKDEGYDYALFADQNNFMCPAIKRLTKLLGKQMEPCVIFPSYTMITNKKMRQPWISSLPGFIDRTASGCLLNKAVHRAVICSLKKNENHDAAKVIDSFGPSRILFDDDLYVHDELFTDIDDGKKYYSDRMSSWTDPSVSEGADRFDVMLIAEDIYSYLNWLQLSDRKYGVEEIDGLLERTKISDREKIQALEALCSTLYFEKYQRFKHSFGPEKNAKEYLKDKVGFSPKTDRLVSFIEKLRKSRKK